MTKHESILAKISGLNVSRTKGEPAPHKPLLLLIVLELAETGEILSDVLPLSPELAFRFSSYWSVVSHRRSQKPDVRLPFHHLNSDGFWEALTDEGQPSPDRKLTRYVKLSQDFLSFIQDKKWRTLARRTLIAKYFQPNERIALYTMYRIPIPSDDEIEQDVSMPQAWEPKQKGRDVRFRLNVVAAYNYTCALTGYRLTTISSGSIVDAAHIHSFSASQNDDTRNGIALSKNAHWMFDNGMWTISDDYKIIVAVGHFSENSPNQKPLLEYHGQSINLPIDSKFWPSPIHLNWHRKQRFLKG